ncbi:hypothetical protein EYC08_19110 [Tabrizicola sp. WMC-M-20]|nr:hypothetical protein EYC08_19110 [Tabrizicola sp. WMC-M-20]
MADELNIDPSWVRSYSVRNVRILKQFRGTIPMNPITQAEINKAAWGACDTFRGVVASASAASFFSGCRPWCKSLLTYRGW